MKRWQITHSLYMSHYLASHRSIFDDIMSSSFDFTPWLPALWNAADFRPLYSLTLFYLLLPNPPSCAISNSMANYPSRPGGQGTSIPSKFSFLLWSSTSYVLNLAQTVCRPPQWKCVSFGRCSKFYNGSSSPRIEFFHFIWAVRVFMSQA